MKKARFTETQIVNILKLADSGMKVCSGQQKLVTVLELSQYNRSDSLGVKPPLY